MSCLLVSPRGKLAQHQYHFENCRNTDLTEENLAIVGLLKDDDFCGQQNQQPVNTKAHLSALYYNHGWVVVRVRQDPPFSLVLPSET